MELQIALYKLQLHAQKWSIKSVSSLSWHSTLQLALIEINKNKTHVSLYNLFFSKRANEIRISEKYTLNRKTFNLR
jgi:hypothetical protein